MNRANKQNIGKTSVSKPISQDVQKVPRQISDYISLKSNRFVEICTIYLDGMSMDDLPYLSPEDLIGLVPSNQYQHKLLMTILTKRYLYNPTNETTKNDKKKKDSKCSDQSDRSEDSCDCFSEN
jgi:hypothetical protein